jgi:sulfate transport system substrate-binding protein
MFTSRHGVRRLTLVVAPFVALALTACSGGSSDVVGGDAKADSTPDPGSGSGKVTLNLVAYSVPKSAFDLLIPAFQATEAGKNVEFASSYGPSGDQSRKVADGLKTDVVQLALEPDITRLVDAKLVDASWNTDEHKGVPSTSVVTLVVRKGNPKGIEDWDDIVSGGVEVVTPSVLSSGGAKWNLLAPYALKSNGGEDEQAGLDFVQEILEHTKAQPKSAREATELFENGQGDVLLSYESEASIAAKANDDIELVVPPTTFKIETPLAVISNSENKAAAEAFRDFLYSDEAQKIWAEAGFRPVVDSVASAFADKFKAPEKLYSITDLGGWSEVNTELFDAEDGAIIKLYDEIAS